MTIAQLGYPSGVYPKPGQIGGALIRQVVGFLREKGLSLPITSHILIAVSGGSDSVGLAHLLIHFGRRIVDQRNISLLHINHRWRKEESDQDEDFVKQLAERWNIPLIVHRLSGPPQDSGSSWEEEARLKRKAIFAEEAQRIQGRVFTAHQADDLAETVLWRLFTGSNLTHGGGIAFCHEDEIRPFLKVRKKVIESYLQEVNESFRVDSTNHSGRFLRSKMRMHLMPEVERLFPRAIDHLVHLALFAQRTLDQEEAKFHGLTNSVNQQAESEGFCWERLFKAAGLKARRYHFQAILDKENAGKNGYGEIHLPGGWRLVREKIDPNLSISDEVGNNLT